MSVSVGTYEFDELCYDSDCDVLSLHRGGEPERAADIFETPEGHLVLLDVDGEVTGITLIGAKCLIDRDGKVPVTLPRVVQADADEIAQALAG
jgi:uncharacterized protein YuzE